MRTNNRITEDMQLSGIYPLNLSQDNFFHSAINSLKRGVQLDSECKVRCLSPLLDENGLLSTTGF